MSPQQEAFGYKYKKKLIQISAYLRSLQNWPHDRWKIFE